MFDVLEAERRRQAEAPSCVELFVDGWVTDVDEAQAGCMEDGSMHVGGVGVRECTDGRRLVWSDWGWGFEGEPWSADGTTPPAVAVEECGA